jgi:hypothetical protein
MPQKLKGALESTSTTPRISSGKGFALSRRKTGGKYLWVTERASSESEDHFLIKALVVKLLAARKGIENASAGQIRSRILTEYKDVNSGEVYDVYDSGDGIAYEVETLYGEGPFPLKKLQRSAEKRPRVRVVLDPFCASLHLDEVMDLRRELMSGGKEGGKVF